MPKRSKDHTEGLGGGLGDEDYDWIKYLGEGRAPASSSASSSSGGASWSGGSGYGARPARPAAPHGRQSPPGEQDTDPGSGTVSSPGLEADSRSRRRAAGRGREDGGRRRRDRDRVTGGQSGPAGGSAAEDDDTGPGGYGAIGQGSHGSGGYGPDDYGAGGYSAGGYGAGGYGTADASGFGPGSDGVAGYDSAGYGTSASGTGGNGSGAAAGYGPDGWAGPEYGGDSGRPRHGGSGGRDPAGSPSGRGYEAGRGGPADQGGRPTSGDSRTTPGRAVRLTAGRAVDLQAHPAEALFNPAAEEYGQPLYAVPDAPDDARGWSQTARRDPFRAAAPERAWPDDPFADTDAGRRARRALPGPAAGARALPAGRQDAAGRAEPAAWPETGENRVSADRPGTPGGGGTEIWPEATGWAELGDTSAAAGWREASARANQAAAQEPALWSEPTGWPETDEEHGAEPWSEPTGWPQAPDDAAFPLDEDFGLGSGRGGRTGPQSRIGDGELGSGAGADGATRQFHLAAGAADAAGTGAPAASAAAVAAVPATRRKQKQSDRRQNTGGSKKADRKAARARKKAGVAPEAAIANAATRPAVGGLPGRPGDAEATSTGPLAPALPPVDPAGAPARPASTATGTKSKKAAPAKGRRRGRKVLRAGAVVIAAALAVAAYLVLRPKTPHVISTPPTLGSFSKQSANAGAEQFKHRLLATAGGEVKNVVAAVYQRTSGPGTNTGPQIVVFIGGNLAGHASGSDLIGAYMRQMHGSFSTSPGTLGGEAACAPGSKRGPAECAWADNDTFGVVLSATMRSTALANEMRQLRPLVEHVRK